MHELKRKAIEAHLVIIGKCEIDETEYYKQLEKLSMELNVAENIHFVGAQNNIEDWLSGADAVIIPSVEGLSLVALESMAAGVPIIATSIGGAGEIVRLSGAGVCFNEDNPFENVEEIVKKIRALQKIPYIGRSFAQEHSISRFGNAIANIFEKCNFREEVMF